MGNWKTENLPISKRFSKYNQNLLILPFFHEGNTANSVPQKAAQNETVYLLHFDVATTSGRDPEIITVNNMFCNGTENCE